MASAQPKQDFPKAYTPSTVEERIYKLWMERGYFTPTVDPDRKPFVIIMPPPNVTGELHLGHALVAALPDLLALADRADTDRIKAKLAELVPEYNISPQGQPSATVTV